MGRLTRADPTEAIHRLSPHVVLIGNGWPTLTADSAWSMKVSHHAKQISSTPGAPATRPTCSVKTTPKSGDGVEINLFIFLGQSFVTTDSAAT